jgi:hypothetical protein
VVVIGFGLIEGSVWGVMDFWLTSTAYPSRILGLPRHFIYVFRVAFVHLFVCNCGDLGVAVDLY